MSRLHPDVIGAAYSHFDDSAEKCARRVLATLAKPECSGSIARAALGAIRKLPETPHP